MKRIRNTLLLGLLGTLGILLMGFGWLCYSSSGARWLMTTAADWGGVAVTVERLEGRLADQLSIEGLVADLGEIQLTTASLELDWSLWSLLGRELQIERLVVSGMEIVDLLPAAETSSSAGPPELATFVPASSWPIPEGLSGRVGLLELHDFDYRDAEGPVAIAEVIEARLELSDHLLSAETLNYVSPYVHLRGAATWNLQTMDLDYQAEVSLPAELVEAETLAVASLPVTAAGHLRVRGDWTAYRGTLELENEETSLGGQAVGTLDGVWFSDLSGRWLQGGLKDGRLDLDWSGDFRMDWQAQAVALNPEKTVIGRPGALSFSSRGHLDVPDNSPLVIDGELSALEGQVDGRPLTGQGRVRWAGEELLLDGISLLSEGLELEASGDLAEQLDVALQVADLGHWLAAAGGQVALDGWLTWGQGRLAGDVRGHGRQLFWQEWQAETADVTASYAGPDAPIGLAIKAKDVAFEDVRVLDARLGVNGLLQDHEIELFTRSERSHLQLEASGGWDGEVWEGELSQLRTRLVAGSELVLQAPVGLRWGEARWALSPMMLADAEGEELRVSGHYQESGEYGDISVAWSQFLLQRLSAFFPELTLDGSSSGELMLLLVDDAAEQLLVSADAQGSFRHSAWSEPIEKAHLDIDWSDRQLTISAAASAGTDTSLNIDGEAEHPLGFDVPERGHVSFQVNNIRLKGLSPWLPKELELDGRAKLQGEGEWLGAGRFSLNAEASSRGGHVIWHEPQGQLKAAIEQVDLAMLWQEEQLVAEAEFALGNQGELKADARLPLPAVWPVHFSQQAPLSVVVKGTLVETGMVAAMLPLPVEELTGELTVDAQLAGSWQQPDLNGQFQLQGAGGYFPQLGVSVDPLELKLLLKGDRLQVDTFRLVSGQSELVGSGDIRLGKGTIESYRFQLDGESFQAVDLPELSLKLSPDLTVEGDTNGLQARGRIDISHLLLRGVQGTGEVRPSPDVVVLQPESEDEPVAKFKSDVDLNVALGDDVRIAAGGLNVRLTGGARVALDDRARPTANGEIRLAEGDFAAYGVRLKIQQGVLRYQDAPVDNPRLNIVALRDAGRVKAGVQITGTAQRPQTTLYSKPAMPEKDILFTILTGRPVTPGNEDSSALMLGAGTLIAPGESALAAVGLTNIDIHGFFAGDGGLRLRRRLNERWEVESVLGNNSGVDLFYVIEFE